MLAIYEKYINANAIEFQNCSYSPSSPAMIRLSSAAPNLLEAAETTLVNVQV